MKNIIISVTILFNTFMYSQEMRLMESMCKVEVFNNDSSRFEPNELYKGCYGFYETISNDTIILAIVGFSDTTRTDITYYKVLSHQNMVHNDLHWVYRAIQLNTGEECYIHHFRQQYYEYDLGYYNMVRVDLKNYTIRYIDEQKSQ